MGTRPCWQNGWPNRRPQLRHRHRRAAVLSLVAQGYGAHGSEAADADEFERQLTAALATSGVSCLAVRIQRAASPAF